MNIGNDALRALMELRGNVHFQTLLGGLEEFAHDTIVRAIEAPVDQRVEQTAYARAVRDLWRVMAAGVLGQPMRTVKASPRSKRELEAVNGDILA